MGNSSLKKLYYIIYIYNLPPHLCPRGIWHGTARTHRRGNARVKQSSLALKEGLAYTCKHKQNNDESYLSSQMWTLRPCQGQLWFFIEGVTWPHPRSLAHSFMALSLGKCFMFANLWAWWAVTMFAHRSPTCVLGFGHRSHTSGIWHMAHQ